MYNTIQHHLARLVGRVEIGYVVLHNTILQPLGYSSYGLKMSTGIMGTCAEPGLLRVQGGSLAALHITLCSD